MEFVRNTRFPGELGSRFPFGLRCLNLDRHRLAVDRITPVIPSSGLLSALIPENDAGYGEGALALCRCRPDPGVRHWDLDSL